MTVLDEPLDDLLRTFRADEAAIDDALRDRMWGEVVAATGLAGARGRRRPDRRGQRVFALAAALLTAALAGAVVARATVDDKPGTVTAGVADGPRTADDARLPTLDEVADIVAARREPVLGEPGATYAHLVASTVHHAPVGSGGDLAGQDETWVAADGTGRRVSARVDGANAGDLLFHEPGALPLGRMRPEVALGLPDDADQVIDTVLEETGLAGQPVEGIAAALMELLAQPGIPPAARAGGLRALDHIGFTVSDGPLEGTVTLTGPADEGSTLAAVLDVATGRVRSQQRANPDGSTLATWYSEADLRATTD